jgi:hypothetical protein
MPKAKERKLHEMLKASDERCARLLSDCTGFTEIAELDAQVASLESKVAAKDREINSLKAKCGNLTDKNKSLGSENTALKKDASRLKLDIKVSYSLYGELERKYVATEKKRFEWAQMARALGVKLKEARAEIRRLKAKTGRDCTNSSIPPSVCPNIKKTVHNSREKTGRKPGGQVGHRGHVRRKHKPDAIVFLDTPKACPGCGGTLEQTGAEKRRQITDIALTLHTSECVSAVCRCPKCGTLEYTDFPAGMENEANYGNNLRAISTFLANSCNVSIDNITAFLYEATAHRLMLSKGSVHNFLSGFSKKAQSAILDIADAVKASDVVGSDATHTRSEGRRSYVYNFNSKNGAIYTASDCKGLAPLEKSLLKGYTGCIVSDHDTSYYSFGSKNAECNVHILRYLKGICQNEPDVKWASKMRSLLCEANDLCKAARTDRVEALDDDAIAGIEARYDAIIATAESEYALAASLPVRYRPDGVALYRRLKEFKCNHLAFTHDLSIPFDNNRSERDLRCVKKKTKQTGGFRSTQNGEALYCDYLSITQTARLREIPVLGAVRNIFDGDAAMFKADVRAP